MQKSLVVVLTAGALLSASLVWAAPRTLSSSELETVKAGSSVTDTVLGESGDLVLGVADGGALNVLGDDNSIPTADAQTLAVAGEGNIVAADNSIAINGDENQANTGHDNLNVYESDVSALALGDGSVAIDEADDYAAIAVGTHNAAVALESYVEDGSAALAGNGNVITTGDENDFTNYEAFSVYGNDNTTTGILYNYDSNIVVADELCVADSFNVKDIYIDVTIRDSFNQNESALCISGQDEVTAIALANTLCEQLVGVNLNVSSSTGVVPGYTSSANNTVGVSAPAGALIGTATAATNLVQTVINNSLLINEFIMSAPAVSVEMSL